MECHTVLAVFLQHHPDGLIDRSTDLGESAHEKDMPRVLDRNCSWHDSCMTRYGAKSDRGTRPHGVLKLVFHSIS